MIPPSNSSEAGVASRGLTRRTALTSVAWGVPAITLASASPTFAASGCERVSLSIPSVGPSGTAPTGSQSIQLTGADSAGNAYTLTLTSTASAGTTTGQERPFPLVYPENPEFDEGPAPYSNHNLSTLGSGWAGGAALDGSEDFVFPDFAPASGNAIVLNQRAKVDPEPGGDTFTESDFQTLTFDFRRNGVAFNPQNLTVEIFDITSATDSNPPLWRCEYYDAVGFSQAPTDIQYSADNTIFSTGTGAGTLTDPYRRSGTNQYTPPTGEEVSDLFTFTSFPNLSTMRYSNFGNEGGWHFVSISGITFDSTEC